MKIKDVFKMVKKNISFYEKKKKKERNYYKSMNFARKEFGGVNVGSSKCMTYQIFKEVTS